MRCAAQDFCWQGRLFTGSANVIGLIAALIVLAGMIYMLFFKKYQEATKLTVQ